MCVKSYQMDTDSTQVREGEEKKVGRERREGRDRAKWEGGDQRRCTSTH